MTPDRLKRIQDVLTRRQPDLTVLMENVHKNHNYAAILRSCDAVGVLGVHAIESDRVHCHWSNRLVRNSSKRQQSRENKTSASAGKWVPVMIHSDVATACAHLKDTGHTIAAAHLSDEAIDYRDLDYTKPTAILMGEEKNGVSAVASGLVDTHITIPMQGIVESLNVSVAAAVILFEAQRQRQRAGCYEQDSLSAEETQKALFEWAYPRAASHFRAKGLPYPELDEDGLIVGSNRGATPTKSSEADAT